MTSFISPDPSRQVTRHAVVFLGTLLFVAILALGAVDYARSELPATTW